MLPSGVVHQGEAADDFIVSFPGVHDDWVLLCCLDLIVLSIGDI